MRKELLNQTKAINWDNPIAELYKSFLNIHKNKKQLEYLCDQFKSLDQFGDFLKITKSFTKLLTE